MNNSTAIVSFGNNIIAKLPRDFCDKHPGLVLGSGIFVVVFPALCSGAKYLTKEIGGHYRYWVDAKYGKPATVIIEAAEPELLDDQTVA